MQIQGTFLETRVARRILFLFILCGLVPSTAASIYAFVSVRSELQRHARERIKEYAKSSAAVFVDQLKQVEEELTKAAARLPNSVEVDETRAVAGDPPAGFLDLVVQPGRRAPRTAGGVGTTPELFPEGRKHLAQGRSLLVIREDRDATRILLGRLVDPSDPGGPLIWGELDPDLLWGAFSGSARSTLATDLCIFGDQGQPLYCTLSDPMSAFAQIEPNLQTRGERHLKLGGPDEVQLAVHWSMFLGFEYGAGNWTIMASEPLGPLLAPLDSFRRYFALVLGLAMSAIFLLANIQIRRTTEPLEELEKATHRVARGNLNTAVRVASGDEFETLAHSFNAMSRRLQDQFTTLAAMADVDRAVLSSLDLSEIIQTVLLNTRQVTGGVGAGLILLDADDTVEAFVVVGDADHVTQVHHHPLASEDVGVLRERPEGLTIDTAKGDHERAGLVDLEPFTSAGLSHFWVFPLQEEEALFGALLVGHASSETSEPDALVRGHQLADQVAVALSNARLVKELNELSEGAITALARTIDAKSDWTAGHSDRVTRLALSVGDRLGLTVGERATLHRAGLLHDIGKIGIPPGILDKPGKLTAEEMNLMRQHTVIGARILEPIGALADVVPVVLHHHERFDGHGYPDGLAGEDIPRLARIMAVADVFDALVSDRPYRGALTFEMAIEIVRAGAGTQFDPDVVRAFEELVTLEQVHDLGFQMPVALAAS